MVLNIPGLKSIFSHSNSLNQGSGRSRKGQDSIVVSLDGEGDTSNLAEAVAILGTAGGKIFIREGTHYFPHQLIINSNTTIEGMGKRSILKHDQTVAAGSSVWDTGSMIMTGKENITFRNLTIEMKHPLWIGLTTRIIFENINFKSIGNQDIGYLGSEGDNFNEMEIRNCKHDSTGGTRISVFSGGKMVEGIVTSCNFKLQSMPDISQIDSWIQNSTLIGNSFERINLQDSDASGNIVISNKVTTDTDWYPDNTVFQANRKKTYVWTCPGVAFSATESEEFWQDSGGAYIALSTQNIRTPLSSLPDGSKIKKVIVRGSTNARTWRLYRSEISTENTSSMASAALNTEDTTISNATIDYSQYTYFLVVENLQSDEGVISVRVTYEN